MSTEIYVAVLMACTSVVILTILMLIAAIYLKVKLNSAELLVAETKGELLSLIKESRQGIAEVRQAVANTVRSTEEIERMTHLARGWSERVDHVVKTVAAIAEPPISRLSKNASTIGCIAAAVLQVLLNPRR